MALSWEEEEFYRTYKPMEGIMTALVLGGFFVFVCLLVVYKTQCKPMWKNRDGRTDPIDRTSSLTYLQESLNASARPSLAE